MKRRRFTPEFKRSIIEQLISKAAGPVEICRRYNLSSGQLYTWKKQYTQVHFAPEPSKQLELVGRVAELERMLGKATLENELLKKLPENASSIPRKTKAHRPLPHFY